MRFLFNLIIMTLITAMVISLPCVSGCKSAGDLNNPPAILGIKASLQDTVELNELTRNTTVTFKVEYTDEDYTPNGEGKARFIPDFTWLAFIWGTSNNVSTEFHDANKNPVLFDVPNNPGQFLRIHVTVTDRYGDSEIFVRKIKIKKNKPPVISGIVIDGLLPDGFIPQVHKGKEIEIEAQYTDDEYDPGSQDADPKKMPEFLWSAKRYITEEDISSCFFGDGTTNPCIFSTPLELGIFTVSVEITDADGLSSSKTCLVEISENKKPKIESLNLGDAEFHVSVTKAFQVTANDPDDLDAELTYKWQSEGGSFITVTNLKNVKWEAGNVGTYLVWVIVTDEDGGDEESEQVELTATNEAPHFIGYEISELYPAPEISVTISVYTTDIDKADTNSDLTYDWDCSGGDFLSKTVTQGGAQAKWRAPDDEGIYDISCTVHDNWDGEDTINLPKITVTKPVGGG